LTPEASKKLMSGQNCQDRITLYDCGTSSQVRTQGELVDLKHTAGRFSNGGKPKKLMSGQNCKVRNKVYHCGASEVRTRGLVELKHTEGSFVRASTNHQPITPSIRRLGNTPYGLEPKNYGWCNTCQKNCCVSRDNAVLGYSLVILMVWWRTMKCEQTCSASRVRSKISSDPSSIWQSMSVAYRYRTHRPWY
jgi:hypothetical protein